MEQGTGNEEHRAATEEVGHAGERAGQPDSLVEFFRAAPTGGKPLDLTRKRDSTRTIKW